MQLSIVIPMYNEAANAPDLLHEIKSALDARLNYEIIVVNDGSQDNTEAVLRGRGLFDR